MAITRIPSSLRSALSSRAAAASLSEMISGDMHPGYIPSRVYPTQKGAVSTGALTSAVADTIYLYSFMLPQDINFVGGKMRVQTAGAGSSMKVGIWANSPISMRPVGAPIYKDNTGVTTQASTTDVTPAIGSGRLKGGTLYWAGSKFTGTLPVMWGFFANINSQWYSGCATSAVLNAFQLSYASTYSEDMPTIAEGASFSAVSILPPLLWLTT